MPVNNDGFVAVVSFYISQFSESGQAKGANR